MAINENRFYGDRRHESELVVSLGRSISSAYKRKYDKSFQSNYI